MEQTISLDGLIAEIASSNYFKDNPHLIDKPAIYRWVNNSLKKFGRNILQKYSKVVEVKDYRADLGCDFGQLNLAVHCQKDACKIRGNKDRLIETYFYRDRIEKTYFIQNEEITTCDEPVIKEEKRICEKFYIHDECDVTLYYKNPIYVTLGRDVLSESCTKDCFNRKIKDSPYSINIKGQTLYANFREGDLYVEYYSLPIDEEGIPIIPKTSNGYLEEYIEYMIKRRILEDAMMSKDAQNLQGMFQYYVQEERRLFDKALKETSPFNMQALWKAIEHRRRDILNYNLNLGGGK